MAAVGNAGRRGLGALFKQAWNEYPEIVGGTFMFLIGVGLTTTTLINYYKNDGDNRRYKLTYVVMRPDDPRVAKIRKD